MAQNNTVEQLTDYFERVLNTLEDSGHEMDYQIGLLDDKCIVSVFWRGRDWSQSLELFSVPQGMDLSEKLGGLAVNECLDDPLEPLLEWRLKPLN